MTTPALTAQKCYSNSNKQVLKALALEASMLPLIQTAKNLPQAPAQASGDTKTAKPKHFIALISLRDVFKLSAINHSVGAVFVHLHDGGFCWVFEGEFKTKVW
jgi:hypothetical protein